MLFIMWGELSNSSFLSFFFLEEDNKFYQMAFWHLLRWDNLDLLIAFRESTLWCTAVFNLLIFNLGISDYSLERLGYNLSNKTFWCFIIPALKYEFRNCFFCIFNSLSRMSFSPFIHSHSRHTTFIAPASFVMLFLLLPSSHSEHLLIS